MDRFWSKVAFIPGYECWEWDAGIDKDGYGRFRFNGANIRASRASYIITNGEIPEGQVVRHKCDNPSCVRPEHLELGTQAENIQDMCERGRNKNQFSDATHCVNGHEFTKENTSIRPKGGRTCRACKRDMYYKLKAKKLAA